jgi:tetratricopeptide (TPR) repeat protein
MNPRWFTPIGLGAFAAFVAGLWAYLSSVEDAALPARPRPAAAAVDADDFFEPAFHERPSIAPATSDRRPGPLARAPAVVASLMDIAPVVAERLDEAAGRLRSDWSSSAPRLLAPAPADSPAGDPHETLRRCEALLRRSPDNCLGLARKAAALAGLGRFDEAEEVYRRLIGLAPGDSGARYNYGVLLCRRAKFGEAGEQFRSCVALRPDHAAAQANLAALAQRAGRLAEAREAWEAFTRLRPDAAAGWYNLGVTWMDYDQPEQAIRCFTAYAALAPEDPVGRVNLAMAYEAAGDLDAARETLAAAAEAWPCEASVLAGFADLDDSGRQAPGPPGTTAAAPLLDAE